MFKFVITLVSFSVVVCQVQNSYSSSLEEVSCKDLKICSKWMDKFKGRSMEVPSFTSRYQRSYYNPPAYYPGFDPISVLASLAFLAFFLQCFTSLFDRSRSILPTIVSSRQESSEFPLIDLTRRILSAFDEYIFSHNLGSEIFNKSKDSIKLRAKRLNLRYKIKIQSL